jgi:cysteine desulfuration protein SufE
MSNLILDRIKEWKDNLALLEGHDKFTYIIDIARDVKPFPNEFKKDVFKIRGCASNLWVVPKPQGNLMYFEHDADAFITKGYAKIVLDIFNGNTKEDIIKHEDSIKEIGVAELLTAQRQSGLSNLIATIVRYCQ